MSSTDEGLSALEWEEEVCTLEDLSEEFKNPVIVRMLPNKGVDPPHLGKQVNIDKPFLVFSRRRRTRAYAENLVWDAKKRLYVPDGDLLEIPKDYLGWFEVLPAESTDPAPKHYNTIEELSVANPSYFLLTMPAAGFHGNQSDDGSLSLEAEVQVFPGEILKSNGVVTKTWSVLGKKKEGNSNPPQTHYLHCTDRRKRDIYLPLAHPGKFCLIPDEGSDEVKGVYQVGSLVEKKFPMLVRLMWGWAPQSSFPSFDGLMRIIGIRRFDTLILHNIQDGLSLMVEVPVDMDVQIKKAKNYESYSRSEEYKMILDNCCRQVFSFLTTMKCLTGKYSRKLRSDSQSTNGTENRVGRSTEAMDMKFFNPSKVFPIEETSEVSESWTLSFRDPDYLYDDVGNVIEENAVWVDVGEGESRPIRTSENTPKRSVSCYMGESFTVLPTQNAGAKPKLPRVQRISDYRASKQDDLINREARC